MHYPILTPQSPPPYNPIRANAGEHAASTIVQTSESAADMQESKKQNDLESANPPAKESEKGDTAAILGSKLTETQAQTCIKFLVLDAQQFPMEKIAALVGLWLVLLLLTFLVGGKGVKSLVGVTCADTLYPVLVGLQFVWLFGFSLYYGLKMVEEREQRDAGMYVCYVCM